MKIKAAVCYEYGKPLVIDEIDLADPREEEVLVKMVGSGICATDNHSKNDGFGGWDHLPMVFGHEGSGIVEKVGPGVTDFNVGDAVVLSYPNCGECEPCKNGKVWYCDHSLELIHGGKMAGGYSPLSKNGTPINNYFGTSTFATHAVSNIKNIAKIDPDVVATSDVAIFGPLACGLMTGSGTVLNDLKPEPGRSMLVYGAGAVGLSAIMAAKICGCTPIICVDIVEDRLDMAKEVGATHVINSKEVKDITAEVNKICGGQADYCVEASGVESCVKSAYNSVKLDGNVAIVAVSEHVSFDNFFFSMFGKTTSCVNMGNANPTLFIPKLIDWYKRGMFPFDKFIKFYSFDEINTAMDDLAKGKMIKAVLKF